MGLFQTRGEIVMTLRAICLSAVAAAMLMATVPTDGQAAVQAGGLTCRSTGSVGYVIGAMLNFDCVFMPAAGGPPHRYVGLVRRVGVDIGATQGVSLGWVVFAPTAVIHPGDLAGTYPALPRTTSLLVAPPPNPILA